MPNFFNQNTLLDHLSIGDPLYHFCNGSLRLPANVLRRRDN